MSQQDKQKVQPMTTKREVCLILTTFSVVIFSGMTGIYFLTEYKSSQTIEKTHFQMKSSEVIYTEKNPTKMNFTEFILTQINSLENNSTEISSSETNSTEISSSEKSSPKTISPEEISSETDVCSGLIQNSKNATLYVKQLVNDSLERSPGFEQFLYDDLSIKHFRFHTVVLDCPTVSEDFTFSNFSRYHEAFVKSIAKFNSANKSPMNVWLRLGQRSEAIINVTFCTEFAIHANKMFPGTITGVLENSDVLAAYVSGVVAHEPSVDFDEDDDHDDDDDDDDDIDDDDDEDYDYERDEENVRHVENEEKSSSWARYSQLWFERLSSEGLKFGLLVRSDHCNYLTELVPASLISKFDDLFYLDEEKEIHVNEDEIIPTVLISDKFRECMSGIAEMAPTAKTVRYIVPEEAEKSLQLEYPYASPFCLQLDSATYDYDYDTID